MSNKLPILMLTDRLGIGGIEKTVLAFAKAFDSKIFQVHICAFSGGGPRESEVIEMGLPLCLANGSVRVMRKYVDKHGIIAIHSHIQDETVTADILRALRSSGVRCRIQSNVFSFRSPEDESFDRQLFISMTNLLKYERIFELSRDSNRRKVLYNPLDFTRIKAFERIAAERLALRSELGIAPTEFVLGKLARKTLGKWSDLNLDILPKVFEEIPNARFLVLGMPDSRYRWAERMGISNRIIRVDETLSLTKLTGYFQCMDLYVHFSKIGECCSAAIQEAQAFSLPIITNSTPFSKRRWRYVDNGQIEQVEHGKSGYICNEVLDIVAAVTYLHRHSKLLAAMGASGRTAAEARYSLPDLAGQLMHHTLELLSANGISNLPKLSDSLLSPDEEAYQRYASQYDDLAASSFNQSKQQFSARLHSKMRQRLRELGDYAAIRQGKEF